jgi:hypothetical protein
MKRRQFLSASALLSTLSHQAIGSTPQSFHTKPVSSWNQGALAHVLPTVSDTEVLVKTSFLKPLNEPPVLKLGKHTVIGQPTDSEKYFWQFHAANLKSATSYRLELRSSDKKSSQSLCDPWEIKTFPSPEAQPDQVRLLLFTCAGGHEMHGFLPTFIRNRLLRRGLSFNPHAAIANGDHVYWDLRSPLTAKGLGQSEKGKELAGLPKRSEPIFGTLNETFLKKVAGPQIVPVYGVDFRSTPVFFIQDDHDFFDNDDAEDHIVTFPPDHFMTQMARSTQLLYYPEFLNDPFRPAGLPGSTHMGKALPVSESFGTLRYGKLLEVLMYSVRRTMTMAGPSAVFLEDTVEAWLKERMSKPALTHVVNIPSNPPGWSAGKWGEWYPDVLGSDGKMTISKPKPYWQTGWIKQHDRLLKSMSDMEGRIPLVVSGDLHASALGRIVQTGEQDLSRNPVIAMLAGTIGTRDSGWPSGVRKVLPQPSLHIQMQELLKPVEEHGFSIVDFTTKSILIRMFKWNKKNQSVDEIDSLEPFHKLDIPLNRV